MRRSASALVQQLARPTFRLYLSDDVTGAEIGGAVKNVLAIACGVVEGAGLGLNARAALIARGFAEMTRFGLARGARAETLAGLSGLGDLVLTCSSANSRNFTLGLGIGQGKAAADSARGDADGGGRCRDRAGAGGGGARGGRRNADLRRGGGAARRSAAARDGGRAARAAADVGIMPGYHPGLDPGTSFSLERPYRLSCQRRKLGPGSSPG